MQAIPCQAYLLIIKICCTTICLVESHSQGVHANTGVLSVLPHTFHVMLTSVVHCHRKTEYGHALCFTLHIQCNANISCSLSSAYVLDCVSFIEILATINLY